MPEEVKVVVEEEEKDLSQEKVDVTPPVKAAEEDQLAAKIKADFEALYGSKIKQLEDRLHGSTRIQQDKERLQREVEQLKAQVVKPAPDAKDPWSGIENGQVWRAEIEKLATQKAHEIITQKAAEQSTQQYLHQQAQTLDTSKRAVIAKYPDLDPDAGNPDTVVSKAYVSVIAEHPDWLTNPYGPTLAMYAMEEKLKTEANGAPSVGKSRIASASLLPPRQGAPATGRITLTREQKAFCDRQQMKYEDYAKVATALEQGAVEA